MIHLIQQILALCLLSLGTLIRRQGGIAALVMGLVGSLAHGGAFAANDAAFTTQTALANMTVGESYTFSVTMKNVGTTSWTTTGGYALVLQNASGWSLSSIANTVAVAVNGSRAFSGTIIPPSAPGVYTFQWCMAQSGTAFGACSTPLTIQVAARAPDATFSSQTTFTTQTTTTRTMSVTMKNTGNTTWKQAQVFLGTQNPQDNMIWGINRLKLSTATVAPNASGTFTGTITAPVSGYYDLQWQALEEGKGYFGDLTPNQNIAVAGGVPVLNIVSPGKDMALINNGGVDIPVRASATAMGIATITNIAIYQKDVDGVHFNSLGANGPEMDIIYHRNASASTKTLDFYMQTTDSFGKKSPEAHVVVNVLNDNSTLVSTTLPAAMVPGLLYEFDVVLKNTGDLPWNPQTVTYGPSTDAYAVTWGNLTVPLTSPVAVGESATFHVKVTAPATEGSYFYSGRLKESTRAPFGAIAGKTVTVARQPPVVSMAAPTTGLALDVPTGTTGTVRIQGSAQPGTAASISKIDVLDGSAVIATVYADTIDQDVSLAVGTHSLKLRATDNWNETGLSAIATVTVKGNDAAFYSQTVPAKMEVGKAYTATVTMRNSGNKPWTAANGYALGSQNPTNSTIWRDSRVAPTSTVSAGGTLTFSLPLVAPTVPGKYNFQWQMLQDGVEWFGDLSPNVEVTVNPVAPVVGALTLPLAGDKFIAIGGKGQVRVQATVPASAGASVSKLEVLDGTTVVATSDSGTIDTVVQLVAGAHTLKLRATDNFGQVVTGTATTAITVLSNIATAVSRTADASMAGGTEYQVTVVMHNAGTAAWSSDDGYALGPVPDDPTWVSAYIPVPGVIASGANATFTFTVRAPGNPGVYPFQWQMLRQYQDGTPVEWFGAKSTIQSISVTGAAPTVSLQRPVDGVSYAITGGTGTTFSVPVAAVAIADSPATISKMEVLDGATVKYTLNNSSQLNVNLAFSPGAHAVQVRATDNVGKIGLSDIANVTISVPPPTATISAPLAGATVVAAASGQASVAVKGTATVFNGATIAAVDLMEGDTVLQTGKVAAVSMTQAFAPGVHSIKLRVTDSTGQKTDSAAVQFTVYQQVTGNAAMFIGQTVPSVMRTAQPYGVTVSMLNTGSTTWTEATQFRLGSFNPQDNRIWTSTGRAYLAASVAPGATAKFTVPVTAPQKAGLYNFQWRMVQDGTGWFGDMTENLSITVADGAGPGVTLKVTPTNVRMAGTTPITLTFSASANEAGRKIARLDVLVDKGSGYAATAVKSATGSGATLALDFTTTATAGVYKYKARATDDLGVQTDTDNVVVSIADSTVLGNISGVRIDRDNKPVLVGWLCQPGVSTALAYEVLLDAPTPAAGGTQLTTGVANVSGEPDDASVQTACGTPGVSHNFKVDLSGTSSVGARKMALRSLAAESTAVEAPDTNTYGGRALYVRARDLDTGSGVLPCDDNSCTMPGTTRIALSTPADGATIVGPGSLFVRTTISGTTAPIDEVAIAVDGNWVAAQPDTIANAYFGNFPSLQPRSTPYLVQSRVRQGNSTLYSVQNRVTVVARPSTTLVLASPATGTSVVVGAAVALNATVSGFTTGLTEVKFYANSKLVGNGTNSGDAWKAQWAIGSAGTYSVQAIAYDGSGQQLAVSASTTVVAKDAANDGTPIPVAITPPHLTNHNAGSLPGALSVGNDGAATYAIPLAVPPGTAGMQPQLSLTYSSNGSNASVGLGWSLKGLSTIHRCTKTAAQDGVPGRISFDLADRLCLDGQRLLRANGDNPGADLTSIDAAYWASGAEYRTEIESFARVTRLSNGGFKVETKDGRISSYGIATNSAIAAQGRSDGQPLVWALAKVEDRVGNYMTFQYTNDTDTGEYLPAQISYSGNSVVGIAPDLAVRFAYSNRGDGKVQYMGGSRNDLRSLLTNVQTFTGTAADGSGGTLVRDHKIHYIQSPTSYRSLVDWMQACANDPCEVAKEFLPKTTFEYGVRDPGVSPGWQAVPGVDAFHIPILDCYTCQDRSNITAQGNFDGSGITSFFVADAVRPPGQSQVAYSISGNFKMVMPDRSVVIPTFNRSPEGYGLGGTQLVAVDLDGDGLDDLLGDAAYCRNVTAGVGAAPTFNCAQAGWTKLSQVTIADINGDGLPHVLSRFRGVDGYTATATNCFMKNGALQCEPLNVAIKGACDDPAIGCNALDGFTLQSINFGHGGETDFHGVWDFLMPAKDPQNAYVPAAGIYSNGMGGAMECRYAACDRYQGALDCFTKQDGVTCNVIFQRRLQRPGNRFLIDYVLTSTLGDLNGDGLTDFAFQNYSDTAASYLCLSKETSVDCTVDTTGAYAGLQDWYQDGQNRWLTAADNYVVPLLYRGCYYVNSVVVCEQLNAPRFTTGQYYGFIRPNAYMDGSGMPQALVVDGKEPTQYNGNTVMLWKPFTLVNTMGLDRMIRATNGYGQQEEVDYDNGNSPAVYSRTATVNGVVRKPVYPQMASIPGMVVKELRRSNGQGGVIRSEYAYAGAMADARGRGSLGFATMTVTDPQANIVQSTVFNQNYPFVGMVDSSQASHKGCVLNATSNTLDQLSYTQASGYATVMPVVSVSKVVTKDLDCSDLSTVTTTSKYGQNGDVWGNVTQQVIDSVATGGTQHYLQQVDTVFKNDSSTWLLGLPTAVTVTKTDPVSGSIARTTSNTYDSVTGLQLTQTVEDGDDKLRVLTTFARNNQFGLVTKKVQKWIDPTPGQATTGQAVERNIVDNTYDDRGRFIKSARNALGQEETRSYYAGTGAPRTRVDANQLKTAWTVDGFGQLEAELRADNNETRRYRKQCAGDCPPYAVTAVIEERFNGTSRTNVPSVTYLDSVGRSVQTKTWGLDGREITAETAYDSLGRAAEVIQPHFEGETTYLAKALGYDDLNRIINETTHDESGHDLITATTYQGFVTTIKNAKQFSRVETRNVVNQIVKIQDPTVIDKVKGPITELTQFFYEPNGNLSKTIDPNGNVTTVDYDKLGRRTGLHDPDLGFIAYSVDPIGRVYQQVTPNQRPNKSSTMVYDMLDRMVERHDPDLESYWVYDTASKGIGQLARAYTKTGTLDDYDRTHTYDSLGRPDVTSQSLRDGGYTSQPSYDAWGRVISQRYQRGNDTAKVFDNRYNANGYLYQLQRGSSVLWQVDEQDAAQRQTRIKLGNGLTEKREYDKNTGRIGSGDVLSSDGTSTVREGYEFDALGNVSQRAQYWHVAGVTTGFTEQIGYDELNRVSTSNVVGGAYETFRYDASGNIVHKSNASAGDYAYPTQGKDAVQPHAVSSIPGIGSFKYDDNGNLLNGAGREITWSSFDMPLSISKGTKWSTFVYGPEHQRTYQTRSDGVTTVYAGAQEVESNGGQPTVKTYWPMGIGVEIDRPNTASSELNWRHLDRLGSPIALTDENGEVRRSERLAYDVWGKRRTVDGLCANPDALNACATPDDLDVVTDNKGFTGHEMLDQLDLVHMNGRVYDPLTARFMSADPHVTDAMNGQNYNRYSYVLNNPTNIADPTGFDPKCSTNASGKTVCDTASNGFIGNAMATFGWVPGAGSALLAHSQAGDGGGKSENAATRPNTKDNATINSANSTPAEPAFVAKHPDNSTAFTFDVRYKLELLGEHFLEKKSETGNFFYGNLAQWTFGLNDNLDLGVEIVGSLKGAKVGFSKTKTYQTYTKENFETGEVYSGKTSGTGTPEQNIARRDAGHHMNDQGFGPAALDKSHVDSAPIRGREQQLIKANGGAKSEGGTSGNKINGISPSNSKLDYYLEAAKKAFGF